jgi:uncharacterized protein YfaS (alpha-2-macroglobulin family)
MNPIHLYMNQRNLVWLLIFAFVAALPLLAFQGPQPKIMKQKDPYKAEWAVIDSLESEGLPKSALEKVEALYLRAKADEEHAEFIKTIMYKGRFKAMLSDKGDVELIQDLEAELKKASFPVASVLNSMLGQAYQQYLDNNYWKFQNRTNTVDFVPEDIESYSIEQLIDKTAQYYLASVADENTASIAIEAYSAITASPKPNTDEFRPSLYDFLAHRAIDHFMNERSYLSQPFERFRIDQESAFSPLKTFVNLEWETTHTDSYQYQTMQLFKKLLSLKVQKKNSPDRLDADLKRLKYVREKSILTHKDSLYLDALATLEKEYRNNPGLAEIWYYQAQLYRNLGVSYSPQDSTHKWKLKEALALCQKAIDNYPESYGATLATGLKAQLLAENLSIEVEEVNLPKQAILASVFYKNVNTAYYRIVKLDEDQLYELQNKRGNEVHDALLKLRVFRSGKQNLPNDGDLQQHRVEIAIEALPLGQYAILISNNENFDFNTSTTAYLFTRVSQLAYLSRRQPGGQIEFVVMDRNTGTPLQGVKAEYYLEKYDRKQRKNIRSNFKEDFTDENGFLKPGLSNRTYFQVRFSKGDDVLFFDDGYANNKNRNDKRRNAFITHFFLDRAIYRPGQPVYYKTVVLEEDKENMPVIVANHKFTVALYDVNGQLVSEQEVVTNEYGTANGIFTAPKGGLLGQMRLQSSAGDSRHYFSVEEYKRPKFEVEFRPLEGSPALGDSVSMSGQATAFAGSSIDGATVNYRVVREVQYPWWGWWSWYRPRPNRGESQEIAVGSTTTDANGHFDIRFLALPDLSIDRKDNPEFIYTLHADVVDITGETRSASKQLRLAYLGIKAELSVSEAIDKNAGPFTIKLSTKNLDGQAKAAKGTLRIERLQAPQRQYVDRYWQRPDRYVINEKDFNRQFAHFAYRNEDQPQSWTSDKEVLGQDFDTGESTEVQINASTYAVGHYKASMKLKDDKGNDIEVVKFFIVYDAGKQQVPAGTTAWKKTNPSSTYQPGDQVNMLLATVDATFHVLYELERQRKLIKQEWLEKDKWKTINYTVEEEDRGNVYATLSAVKYNRVFLWQENIMVPWKNKELDIQYSTFRDKLKPGQEEAWQITIKGPGNEQVAAEMVAAMYDASLDEFRSHNWYFAPFPMHYKKYSWQPRHFNYSNSRPFYYQRNYYSPRSREYRVLNWHIGYFGGGGEILYGMETRAKSMAPVEMAMDDGVAVEESVAFVDQSVDEPQMTNGEQPSPPPAPEGDDDGETTERTAPPVRRNLKETVFFFPELRTDEAGNVVIRFTMNEALTRWKFLGFAHSKDLKFGLTEKEVVTQKELMVLPNPPRFLREGDQIEYTAKVSNLSDQDLTGKAKLQLFDAISMQPIDALLGNDKMEQGFVAQAGQSASLSWKLNIPRGGINAVVHRVVAEAGNYADGEEDALPVLTNRVLVTESMPMPLKGKESRTFMFKAMDKASTSNSLYHHNFTLEYTSNPAWYAVKALPYLMDYPYDCSEQIFSRYFANTLASSIANSKPAIQRVFQQWQNTDALLSELHKNEELKSVLLEETPWVMQAQSEEAQRKQIGLLFDLNRMSYEQESALSALDKRQSDNGGFSWFPGGRENWYITQYILEGMGRLRALGAHDMKQGDKVWNISSKAIRFVDEELVNHHQELLKKVERGLTTLDKNHLSNIIIHYMYARALFPDFPMRNTATREALDYYLGQAEQYWLDRGLYEQGLMALALHHHNRKEAADKIVKSLRERALYNDELGMYWKPNYGYFWYQLPVETHSLMIEVFATVAQDMESVEQLKIWLLKNKQTNHWKTTKATANAVYALLHFGDNWLMGTELAQVSFPGLKPAVYEDALEEATAAAEAGTGYFKASWSGKALSNDFKKIKVKNLNDGIAWGAAYWQYFEDLDKVQVFEDTPLKLEKKLFKEVIGTRGPELVSYNENNTLEPGDKVIVRIELSVDRSMEYVHLKDHRASGFEPINVLSQYKWQGGLSYYESTKDAATHFFMDYLPKGKYVFEYPLRVVHRGEFSNGMASIQCMYAPEFTSHSEGMKVEVD